MWIPRFLLAVLPAAVLIAGGGVGHCQELVPVKKSFIDYILPMPVNGSLSSRAWGAAQVGPRDPDNGLEDAAMKQWNYWDGQILRGRDGRYHLFASRWDQAKGHGEWWNSKAVHAVSDQLLGPYVDKGLCWPGNQGGKGHNVTALALPDGRYAIVVSETRKTGDVFVSDSLDGPWTQLGSIQAEGLHASNISIMVRPDGDFMIVPRSGHIWISKSGILGPYIDLGPAFTPGIPHLEDPVVFHSGGLYHIVVNSWNTRKAYHLTSRDGKTNWVNRGLAFDPRTACIRYTDGTVNHWHKMERPGVVIENGHVVALSLAVMDTPKNEQKGNDGHGSKIIVVPFDGAAMDRDLAQAGEPVAETEPADAVLLTDPVSNPQGGRASASSELNPNESAAKAFAHGSRGKWFGELSRDGAWLQYTFDGEGHPLRGYSIISGNDCQDRDPADWQLQASNDGQAWTTLDTQKDQLFPERFMLRTYPVRSDRPYRMYRLLITANVGSEHQDREGGRVQLSELRLYR